MKVLCNQNQSPNFEIQDGNSFSNLQVDVNGSRGGRKASFGNLLADGPEEKNETEKI